MATLKASQQQTLDGVETSIHAILERLKQDLAVLGETQTTQQTQIMSGLQTLFQQLKQTAQTTQDNVLALNRATLGMAQSLDKIQPAAEQFASASQAVSGVLEKTAPVTQRLMVSSNQLKLGSEQLVESIKQYQQIQKTTADQLATLQRWVESAQQEGGIRHDLVREMQKVADTLKIAEQQSITYLQQVNTILIDSFKRFGNEMNTQISNTTQQTDKHLTEGMSQLRGVIEELGHQLKRLQNR